MKNKILLLTILLINFSCIKTKKRIISKKSHNQLSVSLQWEIDDDFQFREVYYTDFPVYTEKKGYSKIYKRKMKNLKNVPILDSLLLVSSSMQRLPLIYDRYKSGYKDKEYFFKVFKDQLNDTLLILKNKNLKYQFNAISGFIGNKQIVIADVNNNGDLADDPKLVYPKEFRNLSRDNISKWDTIPILDFSYQLVNKEKIYDIKRKVQVYPRANHRHDYLLLRGTLNESLNSYTLMMELKDYAKGTLVEDSINYTVAVQGKNPKYSDIVIKPDSVFYPSHNHLIQSSFSYKKGDTLGLGSKWYKIEGISPDFKKIEFIEVSSGSKPKKGIQFRKKVEDHLIKGLDGIEKKLFSEMDNKEVMLLEFWGTWCGYCKELTPKLVDMHKAYNDKVSFVSIAYDENVNEVKSYIKKNDIEWFQGFVDRKNEKNTIVDTWKINSFPTFVLIDNNQQILYLGSGGLVLEEMNQIIKNKLFKH